MRAQLWRVPAVLAAAGLLLAACGEGQAPNSPGDTGGDAESTSLTIESWRTEDTALWEEVLIPAFNEEHPEIEVTFSPTKNTEYNAALDSRLSGGTAGDLVTCRPFDLSRAIYDRGDLVPLEDFEPLGSFPELARSAWATDDGVSYCVPMASVIHGFYYNADAFAELGLDEPSTHEEFLDVLQALADDGTYAPLAWGTADDWIASQTAFTAVGPSYWHGEQGRQDLISGDASFTDPEFVQAWSALNDWQPYFPDGYEAISYTDTQQLFTLGRAAVFPGGSWEITSFADADFEIGVFPPPLPDSGDQCYISDHTDIGMGINAASPNQEAARTFLTWLAGSEFASAYANALPGFFPLTEEPVSIENELAQQFLDFRDTCESTVRVTDQYLSAGEPNTENQVRSVTARMWNGELTPEQAAQEVQDGLASWYEPQMD